MNTLKTRTIVILSLLAVLGIGLVGCGPKPSSQAPASQGGAAAGTTITEQDFAFTPSSATVKVGDTVTFVNKDSAPHRVSIDGQDLGQQANGKSVTWTATKAGTFPFSCTIHPTMTGQITVQ